MQSSDWRTPYSLSGKRVWVAGHRGMVGSAVTRRLLQEDCVILTVGRGRLDLRDQAGVRDWMWEKRPDVVVLAAAKVGGIGANSQYPVAFLQDNLQIATNVISASADLGVEKLLFLGSSCIYPRLAPQPIPEEALLTGPLEPTNDAYALAKIAGIRLCQAYRAERGLDFISAQPTNLYGPGDSYDLRNCHVLPALIRRFDEAKRRGADRVDLWGSGTALREFLHVEDLADALIFLLKNYSDDVPINLGSGQEVSIKVLAEAIRRVTGSQAEIVWDRSKPDGTPRKRLDCSRLEALGWSGARPLNAGLAQTYRAYLKERKAAEAAVARTLAALEEDRAASAVQAAS